MITNNIMESKLYRYVFHNDKYNIIGMYAIMYEHI